MRYSFIGMSNIGKSYWSKKLGNAKSWPRIDCDAMIGRKIGAELVEESGLRGIADWLGFPSDPQYQRNSGIYLSLEKSVLEEAFIKLGADDKPAIIDTTGSVIYADTPILEQLRKLTCVVYLQAADGYIDDLFKRYITSPKPVIWSDFFDQKPGESVRQTLKRCYPDLLRDRAKRYADLAHVTIPYEQHRDGNADMAALIAQAQKR